MKRYRYVIVCSNGCSQDLANNREFAPYGLGSRPVFDLPALLDAGWTPVRETPMGGSGNEWASFALLLLERDTTVEDYVAEVSPA
jgi:hypothetical protein